LIDPDGPKLARAALPVKSFINSHALEILPRPITGPPSNFKHSNEMTSLAMKL